MTDVSDLRNRGKLKSNYSPDEFLDAAEDASPDEMGELREILREIDSGRFYEMLDAAHKVLSYSDLSERDAFVDNYSTHLLKWVRVFGTVEDLNRFDGIDME